jgi:hypothetical protein
MLQEFMHLVTYTQKKSRVLMSDISADLINQYAKLIRERWDDNAVEALIGVLSTVISERQLEVLVEDLLNQSDK